MIIPAFTFVATAEAVIQSGAQLVVVDIDESFNMDPSSLESAITKRTAAVIAVHMMSAPADMERICAIAKKHSIRVMEDAAWGVGATWRGRSLGTVGDIGCYSFDANKCMSTGEGGMVVTHDEKLFVKARAYHDHGHEYSTTISRGDEGAVGAGFNYRMTELQGAIGIVQLGKLDMIRLAQRANKAKLKKHLSDGGFPFRYRKILDEGESGDALFFILNSRAKHWSHIFEKYGCYRETYKSQWQRSAGILERSIAIPVMVKMSDDRIEEIAHKMLSISREVS